MQLVVFLAECFEVSLGHGTVCNKVYEVDLLVLSKKHFFGAVRYYRDPHVRSVKNNFFSLHCSRSTGHGVRATMRGGARWSSNIFRRPSSILSEELLKLLLDIMII